MSKAEEILETEGVKGLKASKTEEPEVPDAVAAILNNLEIEDNLKFDLEKKDEIIRDLWGDIFDQEVEIKDLKGNIKKLQSDLLEMSRVMSISTPIASHVSKQNAEQQQLSTLEYKKLMRSKALNAIDLDTKANDSKFLPPKQIKVEGCSECNCSQGKNKADDRAPVNVICQMPDEWFAWGNIDSASDLAPFQMLEGDVFGIERFVAGFRDLMNQYKWPEAKARSILERKMVGKAKAMYVAGLGSSKLITMEERLHSLVKLFSLQKDKAQTRKLFRACKQGTDESAVSYRLRLFALAELLRPLPGMPLGEHYEKILEQYQEGLLPHLGEELIRKGNISLNESLEFIEDLEGKLLLHKEAAKSVNTVSVADKVSNNTSNSQLENLKKEVSELTKMTKVIFENEKQRARIVCSFCKGYGHIERYCRNKPSPRVADGGDSNNGSLNATAPHS